MTLLRAIVLASEASVAVLAIALLALVRPGAEMGPGWGPGGTSVAGFPLAYALVWTAAIWISDLHRLRARWTMRSELGDLARTFVLAQLLLFAVLFIVRLPDVSRLFLLQLLLVHGTLLLVHRVGLRVFVAWLPVKARGLRQVVVAGSGLDARAFGAALERHPELGLRVAGYLTGPSDPVPGGGSLPTVLGTLEDTVRICHERVVDELVVCLDPRDAAYVEPLVELAHEQGKVVRIRTGDAPPPAIPGGRLETLDGVRVLSVLPTNERTIGLAVKRVMDLVVALVALAALTPVFAVVAAAILLRDGRPVLFRQERIGLHGRSFRMLKFRSMATDAEARLGTLEALNEVQGPAFKLTDDPRITPIGRVLRRTSLDELPQLWNVVRGEMSLVGPRPPLPGEVAGYDLWHRRRLSMKPGITGLWQVSARLEAEFDRWVELDLRYIDRWSLLLDLKIIARTLPAMITGR